MQLQRIIPLILAGICYGAMPAQSQIPDTAADRRLVKAAVDGFARALVTGDSTGAISRLHPEAVVYEGGHAETFAQYRSGHLRSDIAFAAAVPRRTTAEQVVLQGDVALYMSEYESKGRFRNRDIDSSGTETMVLVRTGEGWKIRHIHWSSR